MAASECPLLSQRENLIRYVYESIVAEPEGGRLRRMSSSKIEVENNLGTNVEIAQQLGTSSSQFTTTDKGDDSHKLSNHAPQDKPSNGLVPHRYDDYVTSDEGSSAYGTGAATSDDEGGDDDERGTADHHTALSTYVGNLSLWPLAVIIFYNVSGGPFGIEPTVRAGGPLFAILGFLIFPFIWSIPEALVAAELGSAYPEASGGVAWVEEAFGTTAGLVMGYLSYISGATDNAIYPVLFLEYLVQLFSSEGGEEEGWDQMDMGTRFLFLVGVSSILTLVNYWGLEIVGNVSLIICAVSMSPFVIMVLMGIPQIDTSRWFVGPSSEGTELDDDALDETWFPTLTMAGVLWRPYLNNLFWNLNSFDSAASFSGEVRDVANTYPRAIFLATLVTFACYFFPILIAIGATDSTQDQWVDGYLTTICTQIGGKWLGAWTVLAAGISNLALFEAEMSTDSFQIYGMAKRGLLPKLFARRSRFHTPTNAILLGFSIIVLMSAADFSKLVEMLNFNYSISLLMEYAAFIKLRITQDDVERPFRIPLNTFGCILLIIPPCFFIILLMLMASYLTYVYWFGFSFLGVFGYYMLKVARKRNWCEFNETKKEKNWRQQMRDDFDHEGKCISLPGPIASPNDITDDALELSMDHHPEPEFT